jgi:formate-dependent nitrite reductase membrane component NrfD
METHWHWLIVIYLFLGGLGAGAYLTSFAAEQGWLGKNSSLKRVGYYIAAPLVALGTGLLVLDLGQGLYKPWLLGRLLLNHQSVMTWGVYILSAFILLGFIKGFLVFKNKTSPSVLTWAAAILALATAAYTGLLLAVVDNIPFWNTGIMPVLFVVSALSTGFSAVDLLVPFMEKGVSRSSRENQVHLSIIATELVVVAIFFSMMLSGLKGTAGLKSAQVAVSGQYALMFWVVFIALGLIFPLIVNTAQYLKRRKLSAPFKGHRSYVHMFSDFCLLAGGFVLRAVIVMAALPIWDGFTL